VKARNRSARDRKSLYSEIYSLWSLKTKSSQYSLNQNKVYQNLDSIRVYFEFSEILSNLGLKPDAPSGDQETRMNSKDANTGQDLSALMLYWRATASADRSSRSLDTGSNLK
jgi:hypothetical protein